jgi:low affinity Fe/Cu permease
MIRRHAAFRTGRDYPRSPASLANDGDVRAHAPLLGKAEAWGLGGRRRVGIPQSVFGAARSRDVRWRESFAHRRRHRRRWFLPEDPMQSDSVRPAGPFARFAKSAAIATGRPWAFGIALAIVVVWFSTGPLFRYSDTWQLVINTGTTIVTFLMVFLIQNQQNRDSEAIQIKLDELIRASKGAHLALLDLEELNDRDLHRIREEYEELAAEARKLLRKGRSDTGTPERRSKR